MNKEPEVVMMVRILQDKDGEFVQKMTFMGLEVMNIMRNTKARMNLILSFVWKPT